MSTHPLFEELGDTEIERRVGWTYAQTADARAKSLGVEANGPITQAARQERAANTPQAPAQFPGDVPTLRDDRSEAQVEIDRLIEGMDILDAYDRYIRKTREERRGRDHNIMISCPLPSHPDRTPSADVSFRASPDGVWHCHKCQTGGDKYDFAAIHHGFTLNDYKSKENFPKLRTMIAEDLGYAVARTGKTEVLVPVTNTEEPEGASQRQEPAAPDEESGPPAEPSGLDTQEVVSAPSGESPNTDVDLSHIIAMVPTIDWRSLGIDPDTFLGRWLEETSKGYEPEEYYLMLGLQALGSAVGDRVILVDDPNVRANLMICLVGGTGSGKTIASGRAIDVLDLAYPWEWGKPGGVRRITGVGSGEALVDQFDVRAPDPLDPNAPARVVPVNGLFHEDEMASLASRIKRQGSTLRPYLMQLYDSPRPVATTARGTASAEAEDHFMQLLTTTQPQSLGDVASAGDAYSGFLNRITFVFGNTKYRPPLPDFTKPRPNIDACVPLLEGVGSWGGILGGRKVHWSADAADAYSEYVDKYVRPLMLIEDAHLVQRAELTAKKVCLLLAINERMTEVSVTHVGQMMAIMDFLLACYGEVDSRVGALDKSSEAEQIITELLQINGPMKVRDMKRVNRRLEAINREAGWAIPAALKRMVDQGDITEIKMQRSVKYEWNSDSVPAPAPVAVPST